MLSIGTDMPLQTVLRLIWVYTVCHTYSYILDKSRGSRMDYFNFQDKYSK